MRSRFAIVVGALLLPQLAFGQIGGDHSNSRPMRPGFQYNADYMPVAAANQAYRAEVGKLLNKSRLSGSEYRQLADMLFWSEMAAQAEIREATDLWRQGRLEESGFKTYYDWASFDRAKNRPEYAKAWEALRRGLDRGDKGALDAFEGAVRDAKASGLYDDPLWGGGYLAGGRRLSEQHRPLPSVGDADFVPLEMKQIWRDKQGKPHILPTKTPDLGDPVQNLGLADWWGGLDNDQRRAVNAKLKDMSVVDQPGYLKKLAGDEITDRVQESLHWNDRTRFDEFRGLGVIDKLHDLHPGLQATLREALDTMPRAEGKAMFDKLGEMRYRGASPQAMFNAIRRAALKRNDPDARQKRNEARVLAGEWSPNLYARLNPAQVDYLRNRDWDRVAQHRQRARDRMTQIRDARRTNPALEAWGDDLKKQWEIINRNDWQKAGAFLQGFGGAAKGTAEGLVTLVTSPGEVAKGLKRIYDHPEIAAVMISNGLEDPDKMMGAIYFEALSLPVGELVALKGASYAGKGARWLGKFEGVAELGKRLRRLAQLAKTRLGARKLVKQADEAAKFAEDAAKAGNPFAAVEYARHAEEAARILQQFGDMRSAQQATRASARARRSLNNAIENAKKTTTTTTPPRTTVTPGNAGGLTRHLDGGDAGTATRFDVEPGTTTTKVDEVANPSRAPPRTETPDAPPTSALDEVARYTGPRGGPNDPVWKTPRGTAGDKVGDFSDITGMSLEDIMRRIPADAVEEPWKMVPGGAEHGRKFKWVDPDDGITRRLRLHGPDPNPSIPKGNNSGEGWVARVQKGKQQFLDPTDGQFHTASQMSDEVANNSHIPIDMNPNGRPDAVVHPTKGPVSAKPSDGLAPPPVRGAGANRPRGPPAFDPTKTMAGGLDELGDSARFPVGSEINVPRSDGSVSKGTVLRTTPDGDVQVRVPTGDGKSGTKWLSPDQVRTHNPAAVASAPTPKSMFPPGTQVDVPRSNGGTTPGRVTEHYPNGNVRVDFGDQYKVIPGDELTRANPGAVARTGATPEGYTRKVGDVSDLPDGAILPSKSPDVPAMVIDKSHPAVKRLREDAAKIGKSWSRPLSKVKQLQDRIRRQMPGGLDAWERLNNGLGAKGSLSLGDYLQNGCGVCKQNALATKVGLDEMGIPNRYVRGEVAKPNGGGGGHAWVEAKIGDRWYVVDNLHDHWNLMPVEQAYGRAGIKPSGSRLVKDPDRSATILVPSG